MSRWILMFGWMLMWVEQRFSAALKTAFPCGFSR